MTLFYVASCDIRREQNYFVLKDISRKMVLYDTFCLILKPEFQFLRNLILEMQLRGKTAFDILSFSESHIFL